MDTKLRKFNDNIAVRILAFIMCVIMFVLTLVGGVVTLIETERAGVYFSFNEIFDAKNYLESSDLQEEFQSQSSKILSLVTEYKSESYIKDGGLLNENEGTLYSEISDLYNDSNYYCGGKRIVANKLEIASDVVTDVENKQAKYLPVLIINGEVNSIDKNEYEDYVEENYESAKNYAEDYVRYNVDIGNDDLRKAFIKANKEQIGEIKSILIKNQLRRFNNLKDELNSQNGINYFVTDGNSSYTNMKLAKTSESAITIPKSGEFTKNPAYMIYKNGKLSKVPESISTNTSNWIRNIDQSIEDDLFNAYNDDLEVYLAFNEDYINEKQSVYQDTSQIVKLLLVTIASALLCITIFLYLVAVTGRKDKDGNYKFYAFDKIWTELQIALIIIALGIGIAIGNVVYYEWPHSSNMSIMEISLFAVICAAVTAIGLWFVLSCVRLLKSHKFIRNSLFYKLWKLVIYKWCAKIWRSVKDIYNGSSLMKKIVICTLGICLLSATVFLVPIIILLIVVFAPKWVKKFEGIKKGIEEVKNGNLTYKIPVEGVGELDKLAESINEISEASNVAVQNELKNQRMKTDLISNVSHDLKTPLTSMVTYIDLLKKEGLDSENSPEYLRILDEKTNRLRHLTEDLFEAAKASSGAMPVQLEKVELLSLINQGLGEMDNKIQMSGLEFIINAEKDKYYVMADGQLLWRVVENLLGNVLKYALENSRVYIDIKDINSKNGKSTSIVTLEMKNISKNPLNISAEELMERFKRGDESRTTEGSGLGLAIAKDLVKLQNGWFEVFIDGDLFKAKVMLNKYEEA